jgi:hypothetical protein
MPTTVQVPKNLTFADAKLLRTLLFKLKESGDMNLGKGALGQLNAALHASMKDALVQGGQPQLATAFENASTRYRETQKALENSVIDRLFTTDKPDTAIDVLLHEGSSKTGMDLVNKLVVNPNKRAIIQRALVERMLNNAQQEGILVRGSLENIVETLGEPAMNSIFSNQPGLLDKVRRFTKLVDTISLSPALKKPISSQSPTLIGLLQGGALMGGVGGAFRGGRGGDTQDVLRGAVEGAALMGVALLTPAMLAKVMTRPGAVDLLTRAATTPIGSDAGQKLYQRIMMLAAAETTVDTQKAARENLSQTPPAFPQAPAGGFNPGQPAR